ncbi:MAG: sulfatase, partial [Planctomycetota bacterium]|nr:sulfatase [Planctomycetota bacterium]
MRRQLNILALACLSLSGCSQPADRPNIVVIVLDTVRRDATGLEANEHWGENTPHLDRLAGESTRFTRAFSAAPWTVPSHASMFTGQLPSEHGCTFTNTKLSGEVETMAELLAAEGYATAAFFSNPWLTDRATGLLRGFETRREAVIGGLGKLTSARGDQGGHETVANVAEWLDQRPDGKPFLLFVNFLEAHLPYDPPDHYRASHLGDLAPDEVVSIQRGHEINAGAGDLDTAELESIRRLYCGDVNHADRMLSRLLRELKLRDVFADSVVVVTSDHGENLGEYGLIDHQFSVEESL